METQREFDCAMILEFLDYIRITTRFISFELLIEMHLSKKLHPKEMRARRDLRHLRPHVRSDLQKAVSAKDV